LELEGHTFPVGECVRCQRTRLPADRRGVDPRYPVLETRLLAGAQSIL